MKLTIRNMSAHDIDFAMQLVNEEEWGYSAIEFERILDLDPDGSFLAEESGAPLGVVTTSSYSHTGAIGHLVVVRARRGRAVGKSLMSAALKHLDDIGVNSVLLNAVPAAVRFYERFGFRGSRHMYISKLDFKEETKARLTISCPPMRDEDLEQAIDLDRGLFGDDRRKILTRLFAEFPEHAFKFERDGKLAGFVFGRRTPVGTDVGPWIVHPCTRDVAESLMSSLFSTFPAGDVSIATFSSNVVAQDVLNQMGAMKSVDTLLMTRGKERYIDPGGSILGMAATEFG